MSDKNKVCPFFQRQCLKSKCALYNENLDNCTLALLPYNIYRLTGEMARLADGTSDRRKNQGLPFIGSNAEEAPVGDFPGLTL